MKARTIPASRFKNTCLKVMEEVRRHGIPITVTKRGKPLVRVVPVKEPASSRKLLGTVVYEARDIFSTGEDWEAGS